MLRVIVIFTTTRCDLQCIHCLQGRPSSHYDFPIELLPDLLKGARQFGANKVSLTGGEPYLHPQFEALVHTIVEAGYSLSIVSNGQQTLPYNPIPEKFGDRLTLMFLSLDGATPQTHDTIRNQVGAFERTKGAIRHYVGRGVKVQTTTCLNRLNKHELDEIVRAGLDLGISGMRFAGVIPAPWNQQLLLSDTEKLELYQHICHLNKETPIPLLPTSALYTSGGINFCDVLNLRALYFNPRGEEAAALEAHSHLRSQNHLVLSLSSHA